jgi:hypothetical protein
MFFRKRKERRRLFFEAIEAARGKVSGIVLEDVVDTAQHNEPTIALELLIYKIWEGNLVISTEEYDKLEAARQMFYLEEAEEKLLRECLSKRDPLR